jgi:enterochelin esterase-like enzyme
VVLSALLVGAFLGGGTFGVVRYVQTFWLYRGYTAPVQLREIQVGKGKSAHEVPVTPGTLKTIYLTSPALGDFRDQVLVYLPPGYSQQPKRRYPVFYLLHGDPGEPENFINVGDVTTTSDDLIATNKMLPMILVMPTGAKSFVGDEEWANTLQKNNNWETFVARDLVRSIDSRYRTLASGSERGLGGYSEGAYGALNISFHHVGEFDLIEGWSPYYTADIRKHVLFEKNPALIRYNSPQDQLNHVAPSLRDNHVYIWLYGGTDDYTNRGSAAFAASLARLHIAHAYSLRPGRHTWALWRSMMPNALETASRYFAHGRPPA